MNEKDYDFRNDTGTYQTGRTQPPKHYRGLIAFLIILVILLSGISTALSIMNLKLYWQLNTVKTVPQVAFSRENTVPEATDAVHEEVQELHTCLGITGTVIPEVYQRYYKLPNGIYVSRVTDRSEAQEKGIIAGDIITAINGYDVHEDLTLDAWAGNLKEGDSVELTLYRSGNKIDMTLIVGNYD